MQTHMQVSVVTFAGSVYHKPFRCQLSIFFLFIPSPFRLRQALRLTSIGLLHDMKAKEKFILELDRPLAFLDIEATGTMPRSDRIVEIAVVRISPGNTRESFTRRVNPGIAIPAEATKIHGITDKDVEKCPGFAEIASDVNRLLEGCDLAGYNIIRYDIPLLEEEMARAGQVFDVISRRVLDVQRIFHKKEPRDLTAALAFYCGEMYMQAHGAEADALATIRVIAGQFKRYADLPRDMDNLDQFCNPKEPDWVDRTGRLRWDHGEIVLNFGKKKGARLRDIVKADPGFIKWILKSDFPRDTQAIVQNAAEGKWPAPPNLS